jgi:hypothetical protein
MREEEKKNMKVNTETFELVARDKGGDWVWMTTDGTPAGARTRMVVEAGFMAQSPRYTVRGLNRNSITVRRDDGHETTFKIRKVGGE